MRITVKRLKLKGPHSLSERIKEKEFNMLRDENDKVIATNRLIVKEGTEDANSVAF